MMFRIFVAVIILGAAIRANAEPLAPGKPAGVKQASRRSNELYLFTLPLVAAGILGFAMLDGGNAATAGTGK